MSAQNNTENPATVPQPFAGYHVQIEYTDGLPAAGSLFAAVRTPQGLTLAFVRQLPGAASAWTPSTMTRGPATSKLPKSK
jgi:hypothetical protein